MILRYVPLNCGGHLSGHCMERVCLRGIMHTHLQTNASNFDGPDGQARKQGSMFAISRSALSSQSQGDEILASIPSLHH